MTKSLIVTHFASTSYLTISLARRENSFFCEKFASRWMSSATKVISLSRSFNQEFTVGSIMKSIIKRQFSSELACCLIFKEYIGWNFIVSFCHDRNNCTWQNRWLFECSAVSFTLCSVLSVAGQHNCVMFIYFSALILNFLKIWEQYGI